MSGSCISPTNSVKALKVTNGFSSSSSSYCFWAGSGTFLFWICIFGCIYKKYWLWHKEQQDRAAKKVERTSRGFTSQTSIGRNIASTPTNQDLPERLKSSCCSGSDEGDIHKRNCLKCWCFEHSQLTWYILVHMNVLCACVIVSAWSHIYWCKYYWWTSMTVELKTNNIAFRIICFYSVASHEILPFCHFFIMKIHENYNRLQVLIWSK